MDFRQTPRIISTGYDGRKGDPSFKNQRYSQRFPISNRDDSRVSSSESIPTDDEGSEEEDFEPQILQQRRQFAKLASYRRASLNICEERDEYEADPSSLNPREGIAKIPMKRRHSTSGEQHTSKLSSSWMDHHYPHEDVQRSPNSIENELRLNSYWNCRATTLSDNETTKKISSFKQLKQLNEKQSNFEENYIFQSKIQQPRLPYYYGQIENSSKMREYSHVRPNTNLDLEEDGGCYKITSFRSMMQAATPPKPRNQPPVIPQLRGVPYSDLYAQGSIDRKQNAFNYRKNRQSLHEDFPYSSGSRREIRDIDENSPDYREHESPRLSRNRRLSHPNLDREARSNSYVGNWLEQREFERTPLSEIVIPEETESCGEYEENDSDHEIPTYQYENNHVKSYQDQKIKQQTLGYEKLLGMLQQRTETVSRRNSNENESLVNIIQNEKVKGQTLRRKGDIPEIQKNPRNVKKLKEKTGISSESNVPETGQRQKRPKLGFHKAISQNKKMPQITGNQKLKEVDNLRESENFNPAFGNSNQNKKSVKHLAGITNFLESDETNTSRIQKDVRGNGKKKEIKKKVISNEIPSNYEHTQKKSKFLPNSKYLNPSLGQKHISPKSVSQNDNISQTKKIRRLKKGNDSKQDNSVNYEQNEKSRTFGPTNSLKSALLNVNISRIQDVTGSDEYNEIGVSNEIHSEHVSPSPQLERDTSHETILQNQNLPQTTQSQWLQDINYVIQENSQEIQTNVSEFERDFQNNGKHGGLEEQHQEASISCPNDAIPITTNTIRNFSATDATLNKERQAPVIENLQVRIPQGINVKPWANERNCFPNGPSSSTKDADETSDVAVKVISEEQGFSVGTALFEVVDQKAKYSKAMEDISCESIITEHPKSIKKTTKHPTPKNKLKTFVDKKKASRLEKIASRLSRKLNENKKTNKSKSSVMEPMEDVAPRQDNRSVSSRKNSEPEKTSSTNPTNSKDNVTKKPGSGTQLKESTYKEPPENLKNIPDVNQNLHINPVLVTLKETFLKIAPSGQFENIKENRNPEPKLQAGAASRPTYKKQTSNLDTISTSKPQKKPSKTTSTKKRGASKSTEDDEINRYETCIKIQKERDIKTYVNCDGCNKIRYLDNVYDPTTLSDKWYCTDRLDLLKSGCNEPEEKVPKIDEEQWLCNKYNTGTIVWAKVTGHPWWPAIVDDDPDYRVFYWCYEDAMNPRVYHVTFFDDKKAKRQWLPRQKIKPFREHVYDPKTALKTFKHVTKKSLDAAVEMAKEALKMDYQERIEKFSYASRKLKEKLEKRKSKEN